MHTWVSRHSRSILTILSFFILLILEFSLNISNLKYEQYRAGITPERSLAGSGEITARDACQGGKSLEFHLCEAC